MKTKIYLALILLTIVALAVTSMERKISGNDRKAESVTDSIRHTDTLPAGKVSASAAEVFEDEGKTYVVGTAEEVLRYLSDNEVREYRGLFQVTGKYDRAECSGNEPLDWKALLRLRRDHPEGIPDASSVKAHDAKPEILLYAVTETR